jgi:hypothetical protein
MRRHLREPVWSDRAAASAGDGASQTRRRCHPSWTPEKQAAFIKRYENLPNHIGDDEAVLFADAVHPTHAVQPVGCWASEHASEGPKKDMPLGCRKPAAGSG